MMHRRSARQARNEGRPRERKPPATRERAPRHLARIEADFESLRRDVRRDCQANIEADERALLRRNRR